MNEQQKKDFRLIKAKDKEMENRFSTEEKLSCKYAIYKKGGYMAVGVYPSLEIAERELARKNKQYKIFEIRKIESW